jgi:hypothetical protein
VANEVAEYGLEVDDLTASFRSGKVLCALLHKLRPFEWAEVKEDAKSNVKRALDGFEKLGNIPILFDVDDIISDAPDRGMQLFLSMVIERYNVQLKRNVESPRTIQVSPLTSPRGSETERRLNSSGRRFSSPRGGGKSSNAIFFCTRVIFVNSGIVIESQLSTRR